MKSGNALQAARQAAETAVVRYFARRNERPLSAALQRSDPRSRDRHPCSDMQADKTVRANATVMARGIPISPVVSVSSVSSSCFEIKRNALFLGLAILVVGAVLSFGARQVDDGDEPPNQLQMVPLPAPGSIFIDPNTGKRYRVGDAPLMVSQPPAGYVICLNGHPVTSNVTVDDVRESIKCRDRSDFCPNCKLGSGHLFV